MYPGVCLFFCVAYATHDSFQLRQPPLKGPFRESYLKAYKLFSCVCVVNTLPNALAGLLGVISLWKRCSSKNPGFNEVIQGISALKRAFMFQAFFCYFITDFQIEISNS